MRSLLYSLLFLSPLFLSCKKSSVAGVEVDKEPPVIRVISPYNLPELRPGEYLTVKVLFTDNKLLAFTGWEALRAAAVCGNNPYKEEFQTRLRDFELTIKFLIPAGFAGEQVMRLYAVDNAGNITTLDVLYKALN